MPETITDTPIASRFLRRREVLNRFGFSETTLWRLEKRGAFPAPVRLSARLVGYDANLVELWVASRRMVA